MQTIKTILKVLLLLDDSYNIAKSSISWLTEQPQYRLTICTVSQVIAKSNFLKAKDLDIALANLNFTEINQLNIISNLYEFFPKLPIIFITVNWQEVAAIDALKLNVNRRKVGIQEYIAQQDLSPFNLKLLINSAIAKSRLNRELKTSQQNNLELQYQLKNTQELFKTVVDTTSTLIWMIDAQENYTFLNQAWLSFTGKTLQEGLQEQWRDRIHPKDLERCNRAYQSALKQCQGFQIEYRVRRFDNSYRTILNTAVRRYNPKGEFAGLLCSCLDITQRKKIEEQVVHQAEIDRILAEITKNIHTSLDLDVILQIATEQVGQYLKVEKIIITKIIKPFSLTFLAASGVEKCDPVQHNCGNDKQISQQIFSNLERLAQGEIISQDNTSISDLIDEKNLQLSALCFSVLLIPIISQNQLWGIMVVEHRYNRCWHLDEIKLLKRVVIQLGIAIKQSELYQELEKLSVIDGLTKVANRRKFDRHLAEEWQRLTREKNPLSLIMCDVDYFKLYNDTYGHQAGDRCLYQVAQAINTVVQRPADLVARYGGEEFAVILPNTNLSGAKSLAQKIRLQIASLHIPHINSSVDLYVTLSFGVASCIPRKDLKCSNLVSTADRGLYHAKELGRNRIVQLEIDSV